ncbi:Mitotic checkpoint protein [Zancudomyces culisetae]|uniref:Mitotic checkpoint protein n=1 Tax=Zancudomyces culisetae TaxID=1213189 RepID=A0A1R1PX40_ZANCU|nr:Mitotic checkpoint protein [Zancudomyces culisetae]|eukprot:OMH85504.1 Mitotic checkpoint protein [Zancudomyces culisetae]
MNVDMLVSGSWDKTIGFWDASAPKALQDLIEVSERVYTLATVDNMLVAGLAGRQIMVYDLRNRSAPVETKESLLKYPTRKVTCMPNGQGFVVSSIEGRVAVEYFDPSPAVQSLKYAFKCHRKAVDGTDVVYPVNDMAFHPVHHTFVTGGSDGVVNLWDPVNKKRLKQYLGYPAGVSALDFNCSGNLLAIGSSYTFDQGDVEHLPDEVYIKEISESDVKPKPKSK